MHDDGYFDEPIAATYDQSSTDMFASDVVDPVIDTPRAGGVFVIEVGVPELQRLSPGETFLVFHMSENRWGIDEYDVATQGLISHHFRIGEGELARFSMPFRYVWPAELDLMAQLAGLRLRERWGGWRGEPFTAESTKHVSVWEKP